jgi:predicted Rossmann fold nucleotide-binding protein DprA/Smf involved in DNA uptake
MAERIALMKQNKQQDYTQAVGRSINEYREQVQKVTESAISFLDISQEDYLNSFKTIMQQPNNQKIMEDIELEVREKFEPHQPMNKS